MDDSSVPRPDRKHPRYDVEIRVDWSTGQLLVSERITNLSEGGAFLRSTNAPPEGTRVDMVIWPAGGSPIRGRPAGAGTHRHRLCQRGRPRR